MYRAYPILLATASLFSSHVFSFDNNWPPHELLEQSNPEETQRVVDRYLSGEFHKAKELEQYWEFQTYFRPFAFLALGIGLYGVSELHRDDAASEPAPSFRENFLGGTSAAAFALKIHARLRARDAAASADTIDKLRWILIAAYHLCKYGFLVDADPTARSVFYEFMQEVYTHRQSSIIGDWHIAARLIVNARLGLFFLSKDDMKHAYGFPNEKYFPGSTLLGSGPEGKERGSSQNWNKIWKKLVDCCIEDPKDNERAKYEADLARLPSYPPRVREYL